jgi:hypothetical protein
MKMNNNIIALAIYGTHTEAESAIKELQKSNFDMTKLSIVGRSFHIDESIFGYYNTKNCVKTWRKIGAFWGEICGSHLGPASFFIPGFGRLVFAGPIVNWLTAAMKSAVIMGGASTLGVGLISMGIPENSVLKCEATHEVDKFVLIAHGTAAEVKIAHDIIATTSPESLAEHQHTNESEYFVA